MAENYGEPTKYASFRAIDHQSYTELEAVMEWKVFARRVQVQNANAN